MPQSFSSINWRIWFWYQRVVILEFIVNHNCVYDSCDISACHQIIEDSDSDRMFRLNLCAFNIYLIIHSFIHLLIHSLIHSFHSYILSSVHSFVNSLVHSFIHSFVNSLLYSFICSFVRFNQFSNLAFNQSINHDLFVFCCFESLSLCRRWVGGIVRRQIPIQLLFWRPDDEPDAIRRNRSSMYASVHLEMVLTCIYMPSRLVTSETTD